MATVFTPSGRMSVRSSPFGGSSNPFTSSGKSSGGSSSSGGGSRSSSGNKISENLMSTKEGVVDIRTGKVIAPIGTSVGEANRLASAAFAIQQKATADKKIADQLAVKQATDAATAQSESNLSRTIGGQIVPLGAAPVTKEDLFNIARMGGSKLAGKFGFSAGAGSTPTSSTIPTVDIQETTPSPISSVSQGPIPNQIGLPTEGKQTFGTIGLAGALFETGKRVVGRLAGKRDGKFELGNILSPLDATVVPKAGRGAFQLGDKGIESRKFGLLTLGGAIGLSKISDAKFTTFGEIQKDIEKRSGGEITTEQARLQSGIDTGDIAFEDASTSFETFQKDVFKSSPDVPGITGGRRSPLRTVIDLGLSSNPLTAAIAGASSSQQDIRTVDIEAVKEGTLSIEGATTQRPSIRTAGFFGASLVGGGLKLFQAGKEVTQSGIQGALERAALDQKGPRLVTSEGFVDVLKGTGTADNILATTRNVQASFIDDAGKLVSVGQKDFGVVGKTFFAEKPFVVGGSSEFSATTNILGTSGKVSFGQSTTTSRIVNQFTGVSRKGNLIIDNLDFASGTGPLSVERSIGAGAKSGDVIASVGGKVKGVFLDETFGKGFKFTESLELTAPIESKATLKIIKSAPDDLISSFGKGTDDAFSFSGSGKVGFGTGGTGGGKFTTSPSSLSADISTVSTQVSDVAIRAPSISPSIKPPVTKPTSIGFNLPKIVGGTGLNLEAPQIRMTGQITANLPQAVPTLDTGSGLSLAPRLGTGQDFSVSTVTPKSSFFSGGFQQGLLDREIFKAKIKPADFGLKTKPAETKFDLGAKSDLGSIQKSFGIPRLSQLPAQAVIPKTKAISIVKPKTVQENIFDFNQPFTSVTQSPRDFGGFGGGGFGFGGFILPKFPSLGGSGAPQKVVRGKKLKQRKIRPSFTAVALEIETGLPKTLGGFGINPFAIRGLQKRKKAKKKK